MRSGAASPDTASWTLPISGWPGGLVDKILKEGAKPGDLPIEESHSPFEFVINLKTARALRLEVLRLTAAHARRRGHRMRRRDFITLLGGAGCDMAARGARAAERRLKRSTGSPFSVESPSLSIRKAIEASAESCTSLGWVEGQNIVWLNTVGAEGTTTIGFATWREELCSLALTSLCHCRAVFRKVYAEAAKTSDVDDSHHHSSVHADLSAAGDVGQPRAARWKHHGVFSYIDRQRTNVKGLLELLKKAFFLLSRIAVYLFEPRHAFAWGRA